MRRPTGHRPDSSDFFRFADGGPPPRPNLPHGTVLGVAPCGVVGYNCNYNNFPELPDGEVFDMQTYVKDSLGRFTYSGMKWQVLLTKCIQDICIHI